MAVQSGEHQLRAVARNFLVYRLLYILGAAEFCPLWISFPDTLSPKHNFIRATNINPLRIPLSILYIYILYIILYIYPSFCWAWREFEPGKYAQIWLLRIPIFSSRDSHATPWRGRSCHWVVSPTEVTAWWFAMIGTALWCPCSSMPKRPPQAAAKKINSLCHFWVCETTGLSSNVTIFEGDVSRFYGIAWPFPLDLWWLSFWDRV